MTTTSFRETWDSVAGLFEPFYGHATSGIQWIDSVGDIQVLVSIDGTW